MLSNHHHGGPPGRLLSQRRALVISLAAALSAPVHAQDVGNDAIIARLAALEQRLGISSGEQGEVVNLDQRLRIIERKANNKKSNKWWPGCPFEQLELEV